MSVVLGALLGFVLSVVGALIGAWYQGRKEHERWLRDARLKAYSDMTTSTIGYQLATMFRHDTMSRIKRHTADPAAGAPADPCRVSNKLRDEVAEHQGALSASTTTLIAAVGVVTIVGPPEMNEAAMKLKDAVIEDLDTTNEEQQFTALAPKLLGTGNDVHRMSWSRLRRSRGSR